MPKTFTYEIVNSIAQMEECAERVRKNKIVAYDCETSGLDPYTTWPLLLQFGVQTETVPHVYVLKAIDVDENPDYLPIMKGFMEDSKITKLGHNLVFDWKMAFVHYGIAMRTLYDSFIAESCLTLGLEMPTGLAFCAKRRLDIDMEKSVRTRFIGRPKNTKFNTEEIEYSAEDVAILFDLRQHQLNDINYYDLNKILWLENNTVPLTAELELGGVLIDKPKWAAMTLKSEQRAFELLDDLERLLEIYVPVQGSLFDDDEVGHEDNKTVIIRRAKKLQINSPDKVQQMLESFGVELEETSAATLKKHKDIHPAVIPLIEWRGLSKLLGSFFWPINKLENPSTHRWHPQYKQMPLVSHSKKGKVHQEGASTGRYSSSNFNFQQMPQDEEMRSCFIARPNSTIITADYSSMEVRIAANLSMDKALIEFFHGGFTDFHGFSAARIFDMPLDKVSKKVVDGIEVSPERNDLRNIAKTSTFAIIYGQQVGGLMLSLGIERKAARDIMDKYYKSFPQLMKFLDDSAITTWEQGSIRDPAGRMKFFKNHDPKMQSRVGRQAKNFPVQAVNASQTKYALYLARQRFTMEELRFYATVHDEIVAEIPIPMLDELDNHGHPLAHPEAIAIAEEFKGLMIKAANKIFKGPVEYDVSYHLASHWQK